MILASRAALRVFLTAAAAALAALALALSGCGEEGSADAGETLTAPEQAPAAQEREREAAAPTAGDRRCKQQVGEFLAKMDTLRERLVSGLSYEQYAGEIEAARGRYDAVPVERLQLACLAAAGTPGERAFRKYIEAANSWGACIGASGCDAATIEPVLQESWRAASDFLDEAQRGLGRG